MPESWGPSPQDLEAAGYAHYHAQMDNSQVSDDDDDGEESSMDGGDELLDAVEDIALADEYRRDHDDLYINGLEAEGDILELGQPSSPVRVSPRKRSRIFVR
jgi:hypothetical protein